MNLILQPLQPHLYNLCYKNATQAQILRLTCTWIAEALKHCEIDVGFGLIFCQCKKSNKLKKLILARTLKSTSRQPPLRKEFVDLQDVNLPLELQQEIQCHSCINAEMVSNTDGSKILMCLNLVSVEGTFWAAWLYSLRLQSMRLIGQGRAIEQLCRHLPNGRSRFVLFGFSSSKLQLTVTEINTDIVACNVSTQILCDESYANIEIEECLCGHSVSTMALHAESNTIMGYCAIWTPTRSYVWKMTRLFTKNARWTWQRVDLNLSAPGLHLGAAIVQQNQLKCHATWFEEIAHCRMFKVCSAYFSAPSSLETAAVVQDEDTFTGIIAESKHYKAGFYMHCFSKSISWSDTHGTNILVQSTALPTSDAKYPTRQMINKRLYAVLSVNLCDGMDMSWYVDKDKANMTRHVLVICALPVQIWASTAYTMPTIHSKLLQYHLLSLR